MYKDKARVDEDLLSSLLYISRELAHNEHELQEVKELLERMWNDCLDRRAFGYSAHYQAVVWALPEIFQTLMPYVRERGDLARLCRAIPAIARWLPYTSESGPFGYTHEIIFYPLGCRVEASATLDAFLSGFEHEPVTVCPDCGKDVAVSRTATSHVLTCTCGWLAVC